jgi:hypothetical protein
MEKNKEDSIRKIVDDDLKAFADGYKERYRMEVGDEKGVINSKKNNIFVAELGEEFMFYSAFCRSFDSAFGNFLQQLANHIAGLSFVIEGTVSSFLTPQQSNHIETLMSAYESHTKPKISDYNNFNSFIPNNVDSFLKSHITDNHFYNPTTKEHYVIELKASGDLDNKKAKAEKNDLLQEYFILKNELIDTDETVKIFLATAYNIYGEGNEWKQERVKQFFANEELLIGKKYWNFVCDDKDGFNIVYDQYKKSVHYIFDAIEEIKQMYFK